MAGLDVVCLVVPEVVKPDALVPEAVMAVLVVACLVVVCLVVGCLIVAGIVLESIIVASWQALSAPWRALSCWAPLWCASTCRGASSAGPPRCSSQGCLGKRTRSSKCER